MSVPMTTAARFAGPLRGGSSNASDTSRQRDEADRELAWQRAMEQAGFQSWFRHPSASGSDGRRQASGDGKLAGARVDGSGTQPGATGSGRPAVTAPRSAVAHEPPQHGQVAPALAARASLASRENGAPAATPGAHGVPDGSGSVLQDAPRAPPTSPLNGTAHLSAFAQTAGPTVTTLLAGVYGNASLEWMGSTADEALTGAPVGHVARPASSLRAAPSAGTEAQAREELRVHAEWSEQGLRLWLGADRGASLPVAQLVDELRRRLKRALPGGGTRLLAVVCNGLTVWAEDSAAPPAAGDGPERGSERPDAHDPGAPTTTHAVASSANRHLKEVS
jgi:hypothetical protein